LQSYDFPIKRHHQSCLQYIERDSTKSHRRFKESPANAKICRASFHLKKRSFQSPLTRVSVLPKATYTASNYRGRSDYELTALSRGKHFAKKPNLNFCLTTRASRAGRDRSNKSSLVVFSHGDVYTYIYISAGADDHSPVGGSGE